MGQFGKLTPLTDKSFYHELNHDLSIKFIEIRHWLSFRLWVELLQLRTTQSHRFLTSSFAPYLGGESYFLVKGMIFGDTTDMPKSLRLPIEVIGMQHVLSASGFNVGLILTLTRLLISRFCGFKSLTFFSLLSIISYVVLIGAPASAVRAGLMLSYVLVVPAFFHRQVNALWSLLISAAIMFMWNFEYLSSASFQLSVLATLGLILIEPRLRTGNTWLSALNGVENTSSFLRKPSITTWSLLSFFKDAAITTIAAQTFTLPLIFYSFGEVSLLSLPANTFLIWLTPLITLGGVLLVFVSSITKILPQLEIISVLIGIFVDFISQVFISGSRWFAQPADLLLTFPEPRPLWPVFMWCAGVFAWLLWSRKRKLSHV